MTPISPDDVVPALRHHLVFSDSPQGLGDGLLRVTNVNNGEELRLRGFEYSLARMLDGHRTAGEVVVAAERLGLPLTLEGLEGFVTKLASFDLVGADPHPPLRPEEDLSPFNPRARWDEPTRAKYRQALREGRTGHLDEAARALDDLLARSPQTVEARRLRRRVEERQQSAGAAVSFPAVFHETERQWLDSAEEVERPTGWIHGRRVAIFALLIAIGAALTLGSTIIPIPRRVRAPAILLPIASTRVMATRSGTIVNVPVIVGQRVNEGDVLFGYDVSATLAALDLAVVRVQRERLALANAIEQAPAGDELRARHDQAQAEVSRAEQQLTRARVAAGDPFSESVQAEEEAFGEALEELQQAQLALETGQPDPQLATLRRLEAEVTQLERELADSVVRAPQAGRVITLAVHPGDSVSKGSEAVRLDDSRQIRVIATIDGAAESGIEAGQPVQLTGQGQTTQTTVKRVEGPYVEMVIDNPASELQPGIGRIEIRARPQPLVRLR
ncbi:MAG: Barrel-sandwich domain of CusB or HlyD rane-fusion [Myxococcaceae bacterium]|nr:Barrel-sandwich domain of CusB or HlyD rane-fusion [Myxococcaceae bacterium]